MIDQHYTHTCQVCKTEFPATLNKDGTPRKTKRSFCSVECRTAYYTHKARSAAKPPCAVQGCDSRVAARGLCSKHYSWFMTHGSTEKPPRKARKLKREIKPCEWCGAEMLLTPYMAQKRIACSVTCANHIRSRAAGYEYRLKTIVCAGCHKQVERTVRSSSDAGKYCSRACAFAVKTRVSDERAALRRIGDRRRASAMALYETLVAPEVSALRRISRAINARLIECSECGVSHVRRRPFSRVCTAECENESKRKAREAYKQTEAYKKSRRAAKSRRRARIRGAGIADNIDPIAVFENAKWICHICGGKTLKSKRGTCHDRAPELEHIVAIANGGTHTWSNVACACRKCNQEKGASDYGQMGLPLAWVGQSQ